MAKRRGVITMGDGERRTGTCIDVDMAGHPGGAYVTLVLDDRHGRRRTVDDGGEQMYLNERRVTWLD